MSKYVYRASCSGLIFSNSGKLRKSKSQASKDLPQLKSKNPKYKKCKVEKIDVKEFGSHPFTLGKRRRSR